MPKLTIVLPENSHPGRVYKTRSEEFTDKVSGDGFFRDATLNAYEEEGNYMATYLELHALGDDSDLHERVTVACLIAAQSILSTTPTPPAADCAWAASTMEHPRKVGLDVLRMVLAANKDTSVASIQSATDAQIQSNVDDLIDSLVLAHNT